MKTITINLLAAALFLTIASSALAGVHYVDVNSTNATPPYTNWTTAATNIQDAVDAAVADDEIVVTNGIYASGGRGGYDSAGYDIGGNRVLVDKPLSVRSVNGSQSTTIDGDHSVRCVYLTNGASLSGFTLIHGFGLVADDDADSAPGGLGGGAYGGTLNNCLLTGNSASASRVFGYH